MTKARLYVSGVERKDDQLDAFHAPENILLDDDSFFQTKDDTKTCFIYLDILDDNFKIDNVIVRNNGSALIEVCVSEEGNGKFDESKSLVLLPATPMLNFQDLKTKSKFRDLHIFNPKSLYRSALMRQAEKEFRGWKKIRIKLTSSYSGNYLGLTYFAVEKVDSEATKTSEPTTTPIIKGATLDIPLLSDDDDMKDENPQEKFEQAKKMAHTKLSASPSLDIKPDLTSTKSSVSSASTVKKRTLPSGITAKPTKSSSQTNDSDDNSEKSDTSKKRSRKKTETKKKPVKFKSIDDLDTSDKSDSEKDKKSNKADKKKATTRKKATKKKKYSSDPSDTDDEERMIDDASDADENGNLAGFVVSNKTTIKDKKNLKDGPVTSKENVLVGCVIAISGIQNPERSALREKALEMGAGYRPEVRPDITHLVAAFVSDKGREAQKQGSKIVTKEWIYDCYSKLRRMNERKYSLVKDDLLSADEEEAEASLGSDIDFELSEDSSEKDMEAEDGEYVPKRKKKKVTRKAEQAISDSKTSEKKNEGKSDNQPETKDSDSSERNISQTDTLSKNDSAAVTATSDNPRPSHDRREVPQVSTTSVSAPTATTTTVDKCGLSPSEEQELLRFKKFFDESPSMKKSFSDFISQDIFEAATNCAKEGDIMIFFEKWSLNTPSPKFLRSIAKLAMDEDDTNKEELINSINNLKNKMLQYINLNLSNSKPNIADVDLEGPQATLPSFFEGCIVYFDPAVKNQRELRRYIIAYGGEIVDDFNTRSNDITHVIVNPDYDGNILYNDKRIVDWKWIQHSHRRLRKLNEEAYAVGD
ncbi:hypothetical protein C9374_008659 [Naegleria lovaniensis]|uniref:BRCT domain-containing protein n=1 Tax=Naegleria lovaniensis TaxID=51637 RepID=A0AA88GEL4_NAELO|nr:uncharacterized protein C9374_008659 [Naegleria lovaniensis]KAG2378037.1 hypothetical protein C9374_008659 [Naegleria lovaniensis]